MTLSLMIWRCLSLAYQYKYNAFYRQYCSLLGKRVFQKFLTIHDIPFLPIQFF